MRSDRTLAVAILVVVAEMAVVAAADTAAGSHPTDGATNGAEVSVGAGQQLSTIISATEDDVRTDVENTGVAVRVERGESGEIAEALEERLEELHDRAAEIRNDYRETTEAYRDDDISREEYARRVALLSARAKNVERSLETLRQHSAGVQSRAVVNASAVEEVTEQLDEVSGTGPDALLARFVGERTGELEIHVDGGLTIEAESEDGERSRELRRPDDGNSSLVVAQSDALSTARDALSAGDDWTVTRASVHEGPGHYRFEFRLDAARETGEARVRIDGSSGNVLRVEEEVERVDPEDRDEADGEPTLVVVEDTPAPNATVTLGVRVDGEPVENATVTRDGVVVGQTDADGHVEVTIPGGESEFETVVGDADAELEFEFEEREEDEDEEEEETEEDDDEDEEPEEDDEDEDEGGS